METTDSIAELTATFDRLSVVIGKLAISEDADHRAAGKSKKALDFCNARLRELNIKVAESSVKVYSVLDRIAKELAAITGNTETKILSRDTIIHGENGSSDWVTKVKKGKKTSGSKTPPTEVGVPRELSRVQYDEVEVVHGYRRRCITIARREEALNFPGRICVILGSGLMVVGIEDYVIPLWVPELQDDGRQPYKVIDHVDPKSVVDPGRNNFFIDPVLNNASVDTGNFLAQTHIRPISSSKIGGTQYCVRVGGSNTIVSDLAQCSASQLAFARRFYFSGLMRGIMIIDTERKMPHK